MCASGYMRCLANTKGILVMSSNSVIALGLIVAGAAPLPLWPVAGVAGPESVLREHHQYLLTSLLVVPYRKSEIEINFVKILFFDNSCAGWESVACVTLLGSAHAASQTAFLRGSTAKLVDLAGRLRTVCQNSFFFGAFSHWNTSSPARDT